MFITLFCFCSIQKKKILFAFGCKSLLILSRDIYHISYFTVGFFECILKYNYIFTNGDHLQNTLNKNHTATETPRVCILYNKCISIVYMCFYRKDTVQYIWRNY